MKLELGLLKEDTFYSAVISHAYFSISYIAKAVLLFEGIETSLPSVHRESYERFKERVVDTGKLDVELLRYYEESIVSGRATSDIQGGKMEERLVHICNCISGQQRTC